MKAIVAVVVAICSLGAVAQQPWQEIQMPDGGAASSVELNADRRCCVCFYGTDTVGAAGRFRHRE